MDTSSKSGKHEWKKHNFSNVKSKIGSKDNIKHVAGGGKVKITDEHQKTSHVQSKIGSMDNVKHHAGGGTAKIFDQKLSFKNSAQSKCGSLDNADHKATGGDVVVYDATKMPHTSKSPDPAPPESTSPESSKKLSKVEEEPKDA